MPGEIRRGIATLDFLLRENKRSVRHLATDSVTLAALAIAVVMRLETPVPVAIQAWLDTVIAFAIIPLGWWIGNFLFQRRHGASEALLGKLRGADTVSHLVTGSDGSGASELLARRPTLLSVRLLKVLAVPAFLGAELVAVLSKNPTIWTSLAMASLLGIVLAHFVISASEAASIAKLLSQELDRPPAE